MFCGVSIGLNGIAVKRLTSKKNRAGHFFEIQLRIQDCRRFRSANRRGSTAHVSGNRTLLADTDNSP